MKSHKMWIAGEWVDAESGKTFPVLNPSTEEELGQVALGAEADVDKAVKKICTPNSGYVRVP